jgi:hypothetical protein
VTALGVLGILLGLLAWPLAFVHRTRARVGLFAALFLTHAICGFIYYNYAVNFGSDSSMYYFGINGYYETGFGLSTQFIIFVVQTIKGAVGGTYLDFFLLFQAFGFFGIALLMRVMEEVYTALDLPQTPWSYLLLFLPGIHFWTSAIGKDGILFTACCLALWAAMHLKRRYLAFAIAMGLMILVRPHIALIALVAASWTMLRDRTTNVMLRTVLVLVSLGGLVVAAATMKSTFALDVTSADSISDFLAVRDNVKATSSSDDLGNTAVLNAPYPVRVLSFLFRPLFVDADGPFGYIASLENTVYLFIFGFLLLRIRTLLAALRSAPFIRYALIFAGGVTLALSIDYYNVGLGLRQKTMVVPAVLIIFIAIAAIRQAQLRAAQVVQPMRIRLETA